MLDIKIRWIAGGKYAEVMVMDAGTRLDLGLLDKSERAVLKRAFEDAIIDLDESERMSA